MTRQQIMGRFWMWLIGMIFFDIGASAIWGPWAFLMGFGLAFMILACAYDG